MNKREIIIIEPVGKFLNGLPKEERAKVKGIFLLFKEYGLALPIKYLKRLVGTTDLWELRAKRVRIFLVISGDMAIAVHGIYKKSQKTPRRDLLVAIKRAVKAKEDLL